MSAAPRAAPSSAKLTLATPTSSPATALTVMVPLAVAPAPGAVRLTVGGVVSPGAVAETGVFISLAISAAESARL